MGLTDRLGLARESRILLVICGVDLVVTLWLVSTGQATEGNPLMAFYLSRGWVMLVGIKAVLTLLPIFVLEYCRRHRPRFVHGMLRIAIAAYLGIYLVAFFNVNVLAFYKRPQRGHTELPCVTCKTEISSKVVGDFDAHSVGVVFDEKMD